MRLQLEGSCFQSFFDLGNILVHEWTSLSWLVKTKLNTVASYVCKHALMSWKQLLNNNLKKSHSVIHQILILIMMMTFLTEKMCYKHFCMVKCFVLYIYWNITKLSVTYKFSSKTSRMYLESFPSKPTICTNTSIHTRSFAVTSYCVLVMHINKITLSVGITPFLIKYSLLHVFTISDYL